MITARYEEALDDLVAERQALVRRARWRWLLVPTLLALGGGTSTLLTGQLLGLVVAVMMVLIAWWLLWALSRNATRRAVTEALEAHPRRPSPEEVVVTLDGRGLQTHRPAPSGLPDRIIMWIPWSEVRRVRVFQGALEVWTRLILLRIPARALNHVADPASAVAAMRSAGPGRFEGWPTGPVVVDFTPRPEDTTHYVRERWLRGIVKRSHPIARSFVVALFAFLMWNAVRVWFDSPGWGALVAAAVAIPLTTPVVLRAFARGWFDRLMWPLRTWLYPYVAAPVRLYIDADHVRWEGTVGHQAHAWHAMSGVTWTPHQCWITLAHGADLVLPRRGFRDPEAAEAQFERWLAAAHAKNPLPLPQATRADGSHIEAPDPNNPFASPGT